MAWVVDTCVLVDVLEGDPQFGEASASCLERHLQRGLLLCPVSYIELAPAFLGDESREMDFLGRMGATFDEPWTHADTRAAHRAWSRYIQLRRGHKLPKRPMADILIGSFALRFDGLITRKPTDFSAAFPALKLVVP